MLVAWALSAGAAEQKRLAELNCGWLQQTHASRAGSAPPASADADGWMPVGHGIGSFTASACLHAGGLNSPDNPFSSLCPFGIKNPPAVTRSGSNCHQGCSQAEQTGHTIITEHYAAICFRYSCPVSEEPCIMLQKPSHACCARNTRTCRTAVTKQVVLVKPWQEPGLLTLHHGDEGNKGKENSCLSPFSSCPELSFTGQF